MRKVQKTAFVFSAILMVVLMLCVPVAKQYHPVVHQCCHNDGGEHHCDCPVCCFQLSTFSIDNHSECIQTVTKVGNIYVPHTLCGYSRNYHRCIIIRGPPMD